MFTDPFFSEVGNVTVTTTSNGGHPPEFYAEELCDKLIHIADTAPPEIRMQAQAFREAMKVLILDTLRRCIKSNHTTVIAQLRKAGFNDAAQLVYELHRR